MKLIECLKYVFEKDEKIRRTSWSDVHFVSIRDEKLCILLDDGEHHPWNITLPDITASDWEVL